MDLEQLTEDICSAYLHDPISAVQLPTPSAPKWSLSKDGMLLLNERLYVLDHNDLWLRVLRYKPLVGHYSQNKTIELICRDYAWPSMHDFVKDYCNSCTVCSQIKPHWHKPYGLLKPLPIPERPWDSISMDLIEQLPASAGHTAILVIVDWLSKQGIFIPTHDTLTAVQLAGLFVLHVFSKHGVPRTCYLGPRLGVRFPLLPQSRNCPRYETPLHLGISSRGRWKDWAGQSDPWAVPPHLLQLPARQLVRTPPASQIRIQKRP